MQEACSALNVTAQSTKKEDCMKKLMDIIFTKPVVANASRISLFVGTCLNLVNQGPGVWAGEPVSWWKVLLNYAVPFAVASYSSARAIITRDG